MSLLVGELKKLSQEISDTGKNILIRNYVKEKNRQRIKEGKCDVIVKVDIPSYDDLLRASISQVQKYPRDYLNKLAQKHGVDLAEVEKQRESVINSLQKSLDRFNSSESTKEEDKYHYFGNGIKMNKDTNDIYILGKKVEERVIMKEEYKEVNSRTSTLIKNDLRKNLPSDLKNYKVKSRDFYKINLV